MYKGADPDKGLTPFLKWPGGKRHLLKELLPLIPKTFANYYEPFAGGAALFFALKPSNAILCDNNFDLINCYIQVRDNPKGVIDRLSKYKNSESEYYRIRDMSPKDDIVSAARLIYLTTLSFNGIYRTNLDGKFNVPYGHKKHINPCDSLKILEASKILSVAEILCHDFSDITETAKFGDLVYFDPPYTVSHNNNGFIKYNSKIFSWHDQLRLANISKVLAKRGCRVIISNAYHPSVIHLYKGFNSKIVQRFSIISASSDFRRPIKECIFYNGG